MSATGRATSSQHECPKCDKSYTYKKNLNRHLKYECGVIPTAKCNYCPFVTRYKQSLNTHIANQHFKKWHIISEPGVVKNMLI